MKKLILLLLTGLLLTSCGTYNNMTEEEPKAFEASSEGLRKCVIGGGVASAVTVVIVAGAGYGVVIAGDTALNAVGDTVTLPLVLYKKHQRKMLGEPVQVSE